MMLKKILFLFLVDQVKKLIFDYREVKNFGLSFAINLGPIPNLILVILGLSFFIYYYWQRREKFTYVGELTFVFIFAGALSNIFDRAYFGYVRDFMDLGWGFTFNLADIFVVVGLILFLYLPDKDKYKNFG